MEAWPTLATSFSSSLPSTSSSSASLHPPLLLDLADELWFFSSVVPFPSFSLPCFSPLFSSLFSHSPDPSTLLAQLMFSTSRSHFLPLSSSPSPPPLQQPVSQQTPQYSPWDLPAYYSYPPPSDGEDEDAYHDYAVQTYGDACSYGEIEDPFLAPRCGEDNDAYPMPGYGNVEDACRYGDDRGAYPTPAGYGNVEYNSDCGKHPAPAYGLDEDAYEVYPTPANDHENAEHANMIDQKFQEFEQDEVRRPADSPGVPTYLDAEDALSGIYDAGVLLKDQHHNGREDVLDVVLPNSWSRTAGPFQDGEKSKNVKTNVENRELSSHGI